MLVYHNKEKIPNSGTVQAFPGACPREIADICLQK